MFFLLLSESRKKDNLIHLKHSLVVISYIFTDIHGCFKRFHVHLMSYTSLYKQLFYKYLALRWQIAKQLSGLNPFLLSNIKYCRLKKAEFFFCNKCEIAVKRTIHKNSEVLKALLRNFKTTDHKYRFWRLLYSLQT